MSGASQDINQVVDHLFRREAGKMVAVLTRIFGTENLALAEDVVQDTLVKALEIWSFNGIPKNPSGWLFSVARNKAIDALRRQERIELIDDSRYEALAQNIPHDLPEEQTRQLINDDMLRMMFACCHPAISSENQITLILKSLCGFGVPEIARAFTLPEETIAKRLYRTREFFKQQRIKPDFPAGADLKQRTGTVLTAIYLLFNEGYNSTRHHDLIRKDLLAEAILLGQLLAGNEKTQLPETYALLALMCFQASRSDSRLSPEGDLILLANQDRHTWDIGLIQQGNYWINKAATGENLTAYHLEAAIAWEHCIAPSVEHTDWQRIVKYYDMLLQFKPGSVTAINRAVAVLQAYGPEEALMAINTSVPDTNKVIKNYLYHAVLGEIHLQLKHLYDAKQCFNKAMMLTQSKTERKLLQDKLRLTS